MHPPDPPTGLSLEPWAEYRGRYDRALDSGDEYNRLLREDVRLRGEGLRQQRQSEYQERVGKWTLIATGLVLAVLLVFAVMMESIKK